MSANKTFLAFCAAFLGCLKQLRARKVAFNNAIEQPLLCLPLWLRPALMLIYIVSIPLLIGMVMSFLSWSIDNAWPCLLLLAILALLPLGALSQLVVRFNEDDRAPFV